MSDTPKVELHLGEKPGEHRMTIDGKDVTEAIALPARIEVGHDGRPVMHVNLTPSVVESQLSGGSIRFDEETLVVLKAAGWTPPKDDNGCESPQCQCPNPRAITEIVNDALKSFRPVIRVSGREFYGEIKRAEATRGGH